MVHGALCLLWNILSLQSTTNVGVDHLQNNCILIGTRRFTTQRRNSIDGVVISTVVHLVRQGVTTSNIVDRRSHRLRICTAALVDETCSVECESSWYRFYVNRFDRFSQRRAPKTIFTFTPTVTLSFNLLTSKLLRQLRLTSRDVSNLPTKFERFTMLLFTS